MASGDVGRIKTGAIATGDDAVMCAMEGGCELVSRERLSERMKAAYEAGKRAGCDARRPTT